MQDGAFSKETPSQRNGYELNTEALEERFDESQANGVDRESAPQSLRLLDPHDHRVRPDQMLNSRLAESGFLHPRDTVCARVIEPAGRLDEHVKAHQKTEGIGAPFIVDEGIVGNECSAFREGLIRLSDQHLLLFKVPVVEDVSHHDHVYSRQRVCEEAAGLETKAGGEAVKFRIFLEDRRHLGKVKTDSCDVRILQCDLNDEIALSGAAVCSSFVLIPGKLAGDRHVSSAADAGHGAQKALEARRVGVESREDVFCSRLLALPLACSQSRCEMAPVVVETLVGHFENSADVRRLVLVEEDIARWCIGVVAVLALKKPKRHQRVKKIP